MAQIESAAEILNNPKRLKKLFRRSDRRNFREVVAYFSDLDLGLRLEGDVVNGDRKYSSIDIIGVGDEETMFAILSKLSNPEDPFPMGERFAVRRLGETSKVYASAPDELVYRVTQRGGLVANLWRSIPYNEPMPINLNFSRLNSILRFIYRKEEGDERIT